VVVAIRETGGGFGRLLCEIGEANAELGQFQKIRGLELPGCQPYLREGRPKALAGLRVVGTGRGRAVTGSQSAEYDLEALKENV
jgi:hypothetical protein